MTSVFPRGGESDYTLVFVDGLQVNAFGGGLDFSLLPFGDVAQVEIVRGPQSALFGSNAIGGIVQVTTRQGGPATASAAFEGGSQALFHARAGGAATRGAWSFGGGLEHFSTDGYTGNAPASGETVSNDDWRHTNATGSLGWTHGDATALRGTVRWMDADRGNPGPYGSNPIAAFPGVNRVARGGDTEKQIGMSGHLPWSESLKGRVQQGFDITYADLDNTYRDTFGDSTFSTNRTTARTQTDFAASPSTGVSAGIEYLGERARSTYIVGERGQMVPIARHQFGVFGEVRQDLGPRATITAGLRVDHIDRQALEGNQDPFSPRPPFPDDSVTSVNPRVAAMVALWQDARGTVRTRLHASAGTGIRPPDAFEIAFTDNPSLKPERSRSVDVGVSQTVTRSPQRRRDVFYNRYDDLIVATGCVHRCQPLPDRQHLERPRGRARVVGGVARATRAFGSRRLHVSSDGSARGRWHDERAAAVHRRRSADSPAAAPGIAVAALGEGAGVGLRRSAGARDRAGRRAELRHIRWPVPRRGLLRGGRRRLVAGSPNGSSSTSARMNLMDRPYEEVYGYPALGRTATGGVRVAFRP